MASSGSGCVPKFIHILKEREKLEFPGRIGRGRRWTVAQRDYTSCAVAYRTVAAQTEAVVGRLTDIVLAQTERVCWLATAGLCPDNILTLSATVGCNTITVKAGAARRYSAGSSIQAGVASAGIASRTIPAVVGAGSVVALWIA